MGKSKNADVPTARSNAHSLHMKMLHPLQFATESVFLTAVIDAMEGRDVAVIDIPRAFMQANMDKLVHVCFMGNMVNLLLEIDPKMYGPCVIREGKEKVMYVELLKALYGTICAA